MEQNNNDGGVNGGNTNQQNQQSSNLFDSSSGSQNSRPGGAGGLPGMLAELTNPLSILRQHEDESMISIRVKTMDSNEFVIQVKNPYKARAAHQQQMELEAITPAVKVTSIKEAIRSKI